MRLILASGHRLLREGLKVLLAGAKGVEIVGEAGDGLNVFEIMEAAPTDVILLDLGISPTSGFDVLERLRDESPQVRALVLSMHEEPSLVRKAIELGAAGCLLRSTDKDELVRAVQLVAKGHPYVQGELLGALVEPLNRNPDGQHPCLSPRHVEILRYVTQGLRNKQIAREVGISETTVKSHLRVIYAQLEATSRSEAAVAALRLGLVE